MKKNKMMRLASGLLVAVLLTTCAISGTFAKYVAQSTGTDSARVARWDIELEGADISETFTFDLFNTVNDTNGATETDVKVGSGETIIAPGTSGSFEINLANKSEVNAKYSIAYSVVANTGNIPVQFTTAANPTEADWKDSIADLNVTDVAIAMENGTAAVTVQWRWVYEVDAARDTADTTLGTKATLDTITVQAVVSATQVD